LQVSTTANYRIFGIGLAGNAPWGTNLCQLYESKQDLIEVIIPYFAEGLKDNEFCMWVASPPLDVEDAQKKLEKAVSGLDRYLRQGQMEITSYNRWQLQDGKFDTDKLLDDWIRKEKDALERGYDGLRTTANTFWLERGLQSTKDYEKINSAISQRKMLVLYTQYIGNCSGADVLNMLRSHASSLIKIGEKWSIIEDCAARMKTYADLDLSEKRLSNLYPLMTEGVALHELVFDPSGKPVDYIITNVNPAFERITGLKSCDVVGKKASEVYGESPAPYLDACANTVSSGKTQSFEAYFPVLKKCLSVAIFPTGDREFGIVFRDAPEHRVAETE